MAKRFGYRIDDDTVEYFDNRQDLENAKQQTRSGLCAFLFGVLGLLIGGFLAYLFLLKNGLEWHKWLRFGLVLGSAGGMAWLLAKLADFIVALILLAIAGAVIYGIGSVIWKAV